MEIIGVIVELIIAALMFIIPAGLIVGIILACTVGGQQNPATKKRMKWWMWFSFFGPALIMIVVLSLWGLARILTHTFTV
jgi:hypothetical protein